MKTPTTTSLIPLSVIPLVFWPELESFSFFFPSHLHLLAKPEPPPTDTGDQPDQPPTTASLTLLSSLLLLTITHCREDDEIRREAEGQKPHLKREKNPGLVRVRPGHGSTGFCRVVAPADPLTNPKPV
jgi:hypothetical protein